MLLFETKTYCEHHYARYCLANVSSDLLSFRDNKATDQIKPAGALQGLLGDMSASDLKSLLDNAIIVFDTQTFRPWLCVPLHFVFYTVTLLASG